MDAYDDDLAAQVMRLRLRIAYMQFIAIEISINSLHRTISYEPKSAIQSNHLPSSHSPDVTELCTHAVSKSTARLTC